jgi:ParB-like chromosome segregation protein Spo0J
MADEQTIRTVNPHPDKETDALEWVKLSKIRIRAGFNPRQDLGDLTQLTESISRLGLLQPLLVDQEYNLVSGERRLRVLRSLRDANSIVAVQRINATEEAQLLCAIAENSDARTGLTYSEIAQALERLPKSWSAAKLSKETGYSPDRIARARKLAEAGEAVCKLAELGYISESAGVAFARLPQDIKDQLDPPELIGLSAAGVKKLAATLQKDSDDDGEEGGGEEGGGEEGGGEESTAARPTVKEILENVILFGTVDESERDWKVIHALLWAAGAHDDEPLPHKTPTKKQIKIFQKMIDAIDA